MDETNSTDESYIRRLRAGRKVADAPPGEKIAISGIAGYFPNSYNVQHFMENLLNKVDLCDDDERRYDHTYEDVPRISGKVYNVEKFDAGYFGVPELPANWMDPMVRMLLERTVEAVMDAGINPEELKGTRTGVYIGACQSEAENYSFYLRRFPNTYSTIGCLRSMLAHRLSYALQLNGPSFACDTACSSGLYAFEMAYRSIREGNCDMALVGACNLCLDPFVAQQFARLGVLNMNTGCRPFDRDANGYTRSEGIVIMVLQKEKDCRRIYAKIIHSKVNADGYKEQGITYPSGEDQLQLLKDVYEECRVDPSTLAYIEAHGTGTVVGDPEELLAIDKFFCSNRNKPQFIGSVKGNIGHTEPVSGLCSVVKVLFGMNSGVIPPNIHFDNPRPEIPALVENRVCVLTEKMDWPEFSELGAVNCFGFGGANCHVLLERYSKKKVIRYDETPRLVCFSGRTTESIQYIQDYLSKNKLDYEFIRLMQSMYSKNFPNYLYRGYSILLPDKEIKRSTSLYKREKKIIYLCFGNENVHSCMLLQRLQKLVPFKKCYDRCLKVLTKNNINIPLKEDEPNNILQKVLTTTIIHFGIIDILKSTKINFDYLRGYSMGEFSAGYANGSLTLEEALMASYTISKHFLDSEKSDQQIFEKLVTKLRSILETKEKIINKMQVSKANTYKYGTIEYFLFNLLNPGLVVETYPPFEENALVLNVDFKCNLKKGVVNLEFTKTGLDVEEVLDCIGRVYEFGYTPAIENLFPQIQWPVSRGTPMFSPLVKWNHESSYYVPKKNDRHDVTKNERTIIFSLHQKYHMFYSGHVIDGRILFPATGYIVCVWEMFTNILKGSQENTRVCFDNVKFLRATTFSKDGIDFTVHINKEGYFEVMESNASVVSGRVRVVGKLDDCPPLEDPETDEMPLSQKDIYKELRIRGYHYKGAFKAVQQICGNKGIITWNSNWIAFMDNMLQLRIMNEDTRSLAVPTAIDRLYIDPMQFLAYVQTLGEEKQVPCYISNKINTIYTSGIQITGMRASTIGRKRQKCKPVLETYKFVPNNITTTKECSTRINMQIILENKPIINMKILEIYNEQSDPLQPLCPEIECVLEDLPLIQPEIILFSKDDLEIQMKGVTLEKNKVSYDHTYLVYIASNVLQDEKNLQLAISAIEEDGFIITVEQVEISIVPNDINILTTHKINDKFIYLLRKSKKQRLEPKIVNVSNLEEMETWVDAIKTNHKNSKKVILYSENNDLSGILGLTNCIRREPGGENVSCYFMRDKAPNFDRNIEFYKEQIEKNIGINVFQNGQWGTYRHLICNVNSKVECPHFFGNTGIKGDLSSCDWYEGKISSEEEDVHQVYYAALNFRDVMLASGKLPVESIARKRIDQMYVEGFEFSGRDKKGKRIMGMCSCGSNSNLVKAKQVWQVPDDWSLEEAATVPVVYLTVIEALSVAQISEGKSILIHSGTGGIGQAALNLCAYFKATIFVTVGTEEKREYLLKNYPFLKASHIGNSRNTSFEEMIFRETNGRGVDIVLNSLSDEKLHASIRCLAKGGHFVEIGKYDLANDTNISTDLLRTGCSYQGLMLDCSTTDYNVISRLQKYLDMGCVKPLKRTIFDIDDLEGAFRYMTTGKHIGKVLVKIRDEEKEKIRVPKDITHPAYPRFYCDPNLSYVILGGLGGFGLELADWLMLRGAKYVVLSSRNGITKGYQQYRISILNENGVKVSILKDDISSYEGCKSLINKSNQIAPIGGIFNLAVELRDALLENLTHADFTTSFRPKAFATLHLDQLTRELCPNLQQFVVFSSVSCGRGNAGQTNYGMSNSIMERICEKRKREGYPALAVQWGAVGDVGLVAEMQKDAAEIAIGGTLQQRITNCLEVLDKFIKQSEPVVSSIVVAEKFSSRDSDNLVGAVLNMLGVDLKTISLNSSLAELGMDSMMAIEIKQTLERDYDVFLTVQDMRTITFARLIEINEGRQANLATNEEKQFDITSLLTLLHYDEKNSKATLVENTEGKDMSKRVLLLPGIEGTSTNLIALMNSMKYSSTCLQYKMLAEQNLEDFLNHYYPIVDKVFKGSENYNIIAHSFGGVTALKMATRLEERGCLGKVVLLDSSPDYMLDLLKTIDINLGDQFEMKLILRLMESYIKPDELLKVAERVNNTKNTEDRKKIIIETFPSDSSDLQNYLYETGQSIYYLLMALSKEQFVVDKKLKSKVLLCKPSSTSIKNLPEDYYLSKYFENFEITTFEGDHMTILANEEMHAKINEFLSE